MFTGPDGVQYRWALGALGTNRPKVSGFYHLNASILDAEPRYYEVGHD